MGSQPTFPKDANTASNSATKEHSTRRYVIYPDSISALLASYPDANELHVVSVSGWGTLFWEATLSLVQLQEVNANKTSKILCV